MTSATAARPIKAIPQYFVWSFPGSPVKVQIDLKVIERLQKRLERSEGSEEQGLLWGGIRGNTTEITDFESLVQTDIPHIKKALVGENRSSREHLPVGYYRTVRGELRLNDADLALAEELFQDPQHVFLLIQPARSGPANATFFFWDGGRICGDFPFLEFPLDLGLLAAAQQQKLEIVQEKPATDPLPQNGATALQPAKTRLVRPILLAAAVIISFVATVLLLQRYPGAIPRSGGWLFSKDAPSAGHQSSAAGALTSGHSIGLQAERQNGDVRLTWNRESPAVLNATSGLLSIQDGDTKREITLDSNLVRGGSLLYSPVTDQIQMQLRVEGPGQAATETVIVILPKNGPPQIHSLAPPPLASTSEPSRPIPKPFTPLLQRKDNQSARPVIINEPPDLEPRIPANTNLTLFPATRTPEPPAPSLPAQTQTGNPRQPAAAPNPQSPAVTSAPASTESDFHPPEIIKQVLPRIQPSGQQLSTPSAIQVRVSIDETGKVVKAALLSHTLAPPQVVAQILTAARQWRFRPARSGDHALPSEMILNFNIQPPN